MSEESSSTFTRAFVNFGKDFAGAPVDWIILGLLVIAVAGNWQKARDLTRACELLMESNLAAAVPEAQKEEIAAICVKPRSAE